MKFYICFTWTEYYFDRYVLFKIQRDEKRDFV